MQALRYAIEEAFPSVWRGWRSGWLSTGTIAVAIFVLGGFLLVTANLDRLAAEWSSAAEMSVYVKDDITEEERRLVDALLEPGDLVGGRSWVSKTEALARFKHTFGDLAVAIDGLGDNPLPASYDVRLQPGAQGGVAVDALATRLRQTPGVQDVRYDRQWLDRLLSAVGLIRGIGFALGTILTVAAALTVANVVRLALLARRDEIAIMQLVGAPQVYVRGPFVMEGVFQGGIGAIVAILLLGMAFVALRARYLMPLASAVNLSTVRFLPPELCAALVLGGMAVGCVGGLIAAWHKP